MRRAAIIMAMAILLAGLVPGALAQGPVGPTSAPRVGTDTDTRSAAPPPGATVDGHVDAMRILDDFNRADGPIGAAWTVQGGSCDVLGSAAVCSGMPGWATFNGYSGDGNAAEADVAVSGTDLQYTGLLLNYGAGVDNLFIKVQQQDGGGAFDHAACYTGSGGTPFGLGFFQLDAPFARAHMKVTRVGNDVTLSFTNVDDGAQPNQTYLCTDAPLPEGTGIGILGYDGIARLDNFGVPKLPPLNDDGLLYMTSLDVGDSTFAVYDPAADAWTTLHPYETSSQMAVSADGRLFAHNFHTGNIDRYRPATDTWIPVMSGPPGASGYLGNLKITREGEFLYTESTVSTLWYTAGGTWHTLALPFIGNAMGDYDPTTDQYVVGEDHTTNAHMIDVHTWAITDYASPVPNGETARSGVVLDNRYYFEAAGSNLHSFDLGNPALPPLDHGVSPGWYTSAAADRHGALVYSAALDGTTLNVFDPATSALTPLTGYGTATWHTSLAFVPGPPIAAWKEAPSFAETGTVISYTVIISTSMLMEGMFMTDTLPAGIAYAGNLAWSDGYAWYDGAENAVYWTYPSPKAAGTLAAPRPTISDPTAATEEVGAAAPAQPAPAPAGPVTTWVLPEAVLWDNGPLVTHPGGGSGGADASAVQTALSMSTYGFGDQLSIGNRMADDFVIAHPLGWQIDTITLFAYQTGAPVDPSTITGLYLQIWDGPPDDPASTVVWGDLSTNRLASSAWTSIYRVTDTDLLNADRPIMANVATVGAALPPGTYWLDWTTDGSLASGPWAPPISILGQTTTGNALQYTTSSGAWGPANDGGTLTRQGMPFVLSGTLREPARVEVTFDVTVTAACGDVIVNAGVAGRTPIIRHFAAATNVLGESDIAVTPPALAAALCPDAIVTQTLEICNAGTCPLHWEVYEMALPLARAGMPFAPVDVTGRPAADAAPTAASPQAPARPAAAPAAVPEDVLWDQPLSTVNTAAYVNQAFPDAPTYSSFLADDFTNVDPWLLESIFVPGDGWNGFTTLLNANALTWQIYADCAGVPCGDPAGGGAPPVWTLTLPPNHPQVTLSAATPSGLPASVLLDLPMPGLLDPGTWWLVFYPTMAFSPFGQYGRQAADTTNGYTAQFINPGEGFGYGPDWQNWTVIGPTQTDMAFRLEGVVMPLIDIPWLSESPITGTMAPGTCGPLDVTMDAAGLAPADYSAELVLVSDDPDMPQVVVPVTMTVQTPAEIVTVTYVITDLTVAFTSEVTGTGPFTYSWDFGDGASSAEPHPVHTYGVSDTYAVTLTVANCGTDELTVAVTVLMPAEGYRIYLPLVVRP